MNLDTEVGSACGFHRNNCQLKGHTGKAAHIHKERFRKSVRKFH